MSPKNRSKENTMRNIFIALIALVSVSAFAADTITQVPVAQPQGAVNPSAVAQAKHKKHGKKHHKAKPAPAPAASPAAK
jgi:hypothetical protein